MTTIMKSMMKSDMANPFSNGIVSMHLVGRALTEIHQAAKFLPQAKRKAKKNATVQSVKSTTITVITIPNELDLLVEKIRR